MSRPYASIAMPFMNAGCYLSQCLSSIINQTFADWELLLIDDGSTDESREVAKNVDDPRIRHFCDGQNRKLNERLNEAITLARGKYFVRMDADDLMHPSRLERQMARLDATRENTVLGSGSYSIDADSKVVGIRRVPEKQRYGFAARHSFIHPTVAGHTAWFQKNRYSNSFLYHRSQDAELWCRTSRSSNFEWIDEPLLFYREQGTFKLTNYFGTQLGLLQIAVDTHASAFSKVTTLWKECVKLGIVSTTTILGRPDTVIRGRYGKIDPTERTAAQAIVDQILKAELPVSSTVWTAEASRSAK